MLNVVLYIIVKSVYFPPNHEQALLFREQKAIEE